jgi:hypothetical protein
MFEKHGITVNVIIDHTITGLGQVDPKSTERTKSKNCWRKPYY